MKQRKQFGSAGLEEAEVNERRELGMRGCVRVDDSTRSSEDQQPAKRDLALSTDERKQGAAAGDAGCRA